MRGLSCRVNECEDYRLPERHSMQSLRNVHIFRRYAYFMYKTLDPECGGGRAFRNVDIRIATEFLSPTLHY